MPQRNKMSYADVKILPLATILLLQGCGLFGGGETNLQRASNYKVTPPSDWKIKETGVESDSTYVLPSGNIATVTSSCHKHSEANPEILTRHLLMGTRKIVFDRQEKMSVNGSEGLYSAVRATTDGKTAYLNLFVVGKTPCIFDFTLVSAKPIPAKDSEDFLAFIRSLQYGAN